MVAAQTVSLRRSGQLPRPQYRKRVLMQFEELQTIRNKIRTASGSDRQGLKQAIEESFKNLSIRPVATARGSDSVLAC